MRWWRRLRRDPVTWGGATLLAGILFAAAFADALAPSGPLDGGLDDRLQPPSRAHLFGTDHQGRDVPFVWRSM